MRVVSLLSLPALALRAPAVALRTAAKALRLLADVNEQLADTLRSDAPDAGGTPDFAEPSRQSPTLTPVPDFQPGPAVDERPTAAKTGQTISVAPSQPAPAETAGTVGTASAAAPGFDVAALAAQTAPQIIAAVDTLGTVELAELYEYESHHRRRRTVLQAIDAAAAPPADARDDDIVLDDDVREPDELVYSTETPRR